MRKGKVFARVLKPALNIFLTLRWTCLHITLKKSYKILKDKIKRILLMDFRYDSITHDKAVSQGHKQKLALSYWNAVPQQRRKPKHFSYCVFRSHAPQCEQAGYQHQPSQWECLFWIFWSCLRKYWFFNSQTQTVLVQLFPEACLVQIAQRSI